ncbi:helicase SRCAP [Pimephales promelas]|nr:helicase SRCAP [Pimephales promelas]
MPVLRNLPVRRRLETESRMAAQLGEQFLGRGRGVDRRSALSPKKPETNSDKDGAPQSDSNVTNIISVKRKRGRPPKTPSRAPELPEDKKPVTQKTSPEQSPPHSPKRKRGRPRKDSTTTTSSAPSSPSTGAPSSQEPNLSTSNVMPVTLPAVSKTSPISSPTLNPTSPSNAAELSSSKPDSETNQSTTSLLLSSMYRDSENMSLSTSEHGVDSQGDTHTSSNPVIACIDSDTNTLKTSPHKISTAEVSQTCTASSLTLQLPSPIREPPTCTHFSPIHAEELTQMPVLSKTIEITAFLEPSAASVSAVEAEENSLTTNQQIDNLQCSNTSTHVTSQPLHRSSATADSSQTFVEPICNIAASPVATHQSFSKPFPPALTSGIEPESSPSKSEAPEASVTLTLSTVQQSTSKSDQTSVPTSQLQITAIEAATDSAPVSNKMSSTSFQSPSTANQTKSDSLSTLSYKDADSSPPQNMPVADNHEGQHSSKDEVVTEETEKMEVDCVAEDIAGGNDAVLSQPKRKKLDSLPKEQTPSASRIASSNSDIETHDAPKSDGPVEPSEEERTEDRETRTSAKKRSISRQSSQESVRSSSPSSVSSSGTRSSQSKKLGESRRPSKRKRDDIKSEKGKTEEGSDRKHQSNSSSSSSDSEDSNRIKRCLTRSAQKKLEKDGTIAKNDESRNRQRGRSDKKGQTTNTTEGESSGKPPIRQLNHHSPPLLLDPLGSDRAALFPPWKQKGLKKKKRKKHLIRRKGMKKRAANAIRDTTLKPLRISDKNSNRDYVPVCELKRSQNGDTSGALSE